VALRSEARQSLTIPAGVAHGFYGSAQEFGGRAGIAELGLNSQFADG
jgi:hypothetical protein